MPALATAKGIVNHVSGNRWPILPDSNNAMKPAVMDEFGKAINGLEQVATAASLGQWRWGGEVSPGGRGGCSLRAGHGVGRSGGGAVRLGPGAKGGAAVVGR